MGAGLIGKRDCDSPEAPQIHSADAPPVAAPVGDGGDDDLA
jgi:hypothetical protein